MNMLKRLFCLLLMLVVALPCAAHAQETNDTFTYIDMTATNAMRRSAAEWVSDEASQTEFAASVYSDIVSSGEETALQIISDAIDCDTIFMIASYGQLGLICFAEENMMIFAYRAAEGTGFYSWFLLDPPMDSRQTQAWMEEMHAERGFAWYAALDGAAVRTMIDGGGEPAR